MGRKGVGAAVALEYGTRLLIMWLTQCVWHVLISIACVLRVYDTSCIHTLLCEQAGGVLSAGDQHCKNRSLVTV